jgi:hypothetical protein
MSPPLCYLTLQTVPLSCMDHRTHTGVESWKKEGRQAGRKDTDTRNGLDFISCPASLQIKWLKLTFLCPVLRVGLRWHWFKVPADGTGLTIISAGSWACHLVELYASNKAMVTWLTPDGGSFSVQSLSGGLVFISHQPCKPDSFLG